MVTSCTINILFNEIRNIVNETPIEYQLVKTCKCIFNTLLSLFNALIYDISSQRDKIQAGCNQIKVTEKVFWTKFASKEDASL